MKAAILEIRDTVRSVSRNVTGTIVAEMLEGIHCETALRMELPDERAVIESQLRKCAVDPEINLVLTGGGTGIDLQDVTPDATRAVCDRLLPGIPDAMRHASLKVTNRALLSRAQAGICQQTLIINLPGSPKAARENLDVVLNMLPHAISVLTGQTPGATLNY